MAEPLGSGHLVVIGASAGGIEALSILVATIDKAFPAPILVAQHLDPRRDSHLQEILARRSVLPVVTVDDKAPLVPGTIHLIPPNRQVAVTDHAVSVTTAGPAGRPAPSIDRVFSTAAEQFGEDLIAVILSGTGSDGANGARRVKLHGGTVIVQDPESARFASMPSSLAPTSIDITAPVEAIGALLAELVTGQRTVPPPSANGQLEALLDDLRERSGIDFSTYKRPTIVRRLQRRMVALGARSLPEYVRQMSRDPAEYQRLTSSFLIKVTEFFRDAELFDHLRDVVVPALIADARPRGRELRIWSAGCATGEEAYSVAILVAEALGPEAPNWSIRIFATDLDGEAVAYARRGIYPAASLEHLPRDLAERHFSATDGEYEVGKTIRSMTILGVHDLAQRAPFPRIDLVLCRNVLIYFTPELQRRALQVFAFSLRDGGRLVLGKAETTSPLPDHFALEDGHLKVFRRRGERVLVPPGGMPGREDGQATSAIPSRPVGDALPRPPVRVRPPAVAMPHGGRPEAVLDLLPIGVITVNRRYDIESINPVARRLLRVHNAAAGKDLIHLVAHLPASSLRGALDEALAGRDATLRVEVPGDAIDQEASVWLELRCLARSGGRDPARPEGAVVTVQDISTQVTLELGNEAAVETERGRGEHLAGQMEGYRDAHRRLRQDNEALAIANAELRGANEELLVSTGEVQAATEEVETLNEELQATNEELETLNEELQATVEELNTTNDDMEARSAELEHLATDLDAQRIKAETERARLATLIASMRDGVLVVDRSGHVVIRNQAFERLAGPNAPALEDQDGNPVDLGALQKAVARGDEVALSFFLTDDSGRRRWFETWSQAVPAEMGIGDGGILVIHDTTDLSMRRLQEEFVGIVAHELRTPLTALRGYLQMLKRRRREEGERPIVPLALEQADRLQRLVDELFDVTRLDRGRLTVQLAPVSLGSLLDETVEVARALSDGHEFIVHKPDTEVVVEGDRGRLQQVLLNLFTNAIVHAPDAPDVQVRLRKLRRRIEIDVEDRGPGIPPRAQEALFAPFEQGRAAALRSGLGLGLYIAREIVHLHGGTIDIDSAEGQGTTFTIRLPMSVSGDGAGADGGSGPRRQRTEAAAG